MEQPVGMLKDTGGPPCPSHRPPDLLDEPDQVRRSEPTLDDGGRRAAARHAHRTERGQLIGILTGALRLPGTRLDPA
jgi:hypothetical protein